MEGFAKGQGLGRKDLQKARDLVGKLLNSAMRTLFPGTCSSRPGESSIMGTTFPTRRLTTLLMLQLQ
jgi:hypothetical protein